MDDELRKAVDQRAHALWEAAGRPDGHELVYRLRAEKEIGEIPLTGKQDPLIALDEREPGVMRDEPVSSEDPSGTSSGLTDEPLRRAVENAIPEGERLPGEAEENPISERVSNAADGQTPPADRSTCQGGNEVAP